MILMNTTVARLVRLPHLRLIRISGADAPAFLQAQLSRRVDNLSPDSSALTGWHDARGRVRAVFRIVPTQDGFVLEAPADIADQLISTLRMFVLRSAVQVESDELQCAGLRLDSTQVQQAPPADGIRLPEVVDAIARSADGIAVKVTEDCWHVYAQDDVSIRDSVAECSAIVAAEIRAGLPHVGTATTVRYVPHMLNLDRLGALDFEKGCYPGQEVIARTQHLGSVKRRAAAFEIREPVELAKLVDTSHESAAALVDTPLVDAHGERVGEVLRAARDLDGSVALHAVVALAATREPVFLASTSGAALASIEPPPVAPQ